MKIRCFILKVFAFVPLLFLVGCGFHPSGHIPLAPQFHRLYLKTPNPYGRLAHALKQKLKWYGVHFVTCPSESSLILQIVSEEQQQQLLSVGATQQTRQYNLILAVNFQVTDPQGRVILPLQNVTEVRTVPIQTNQVLAGSNQAIILYDQMRPAIVSDIINRLVSREVNQLIMKKP